MIDVHSGEPVKSLGNRVLDANTEANLCETCYDIVVTFGIENVLAALGRAARVRAGDYMRTSRQQYLRHQCPIFGQIVDVPPSVRPPAQRRFRG